MNRKLRLLSLALALIFISLSACSQQSSGGGEPPAAEAGKETDGAETDKGENGGEQQPPKNVTLDFWTIALSPTFDDYINGRIAKYEQEHPGIKVKWTDLPFNAIENKLLTSIAGGRSPDVVNLNTTMALTLASKNALVDLNAEATEEQRGIYFEELYKSASIGDSAYAFPWYIAPHVFMYNKSLYEQAGLDPAAPPKTWEEVKRQSITIKQKTGKYGFVVTDSYIAQMYLSGVPVVNEEKTKIIINTPEALEYAKFVKSLYDEDAVPKDGITGGYAFALNQYQAGEIAMLITGPQFLKRIKENAKEVYDNTLIAEVPTRSTEGKIHAPLMNVVVPTMSDAHKEAIEFANYITNDESQLEFSKIVNILPSTKEAAKDPFFTQSGDDPESKAKVISAESLPRAVDVTFGIKQEGELISLLTKEFEKMLLGQQSPEDTLKIAEEAMQKKLDEINAQY
ncbi:ABC transporter substrate-binding protein [Paenibacillus alkalitolerans]|uniref:ABC transporter substrate-binding protein n=1 Tax=Paenibacillus alkalitolerans TaxID=2799335 RepID=UPI0018F2B7C7|nr:sugar ABC transporter substrate-binding protein [Paenibacillus alkalitolerans]